MTGWFSKSKSDEQDTAHTTTAAARPEGSATLPGGTDFKSLIADKAYVQIPKVGDIVTGTVVGIGRNEVKVDIPGFRTGIVRGPELIDASDATADLEVGAEVEATILDLENERGFVELSFRAAGHRKAWSNLEELRRTGAIVTIRIIEANKGGLLAQLGNVQGFLPVSQLSPGNYPRVSGGDKQKILEKLKSFVGKTFDAKVLDVDDRDEKLIFSEKAAWEESKSQVLAQYQPGDSIEGVVTALADFGVFVRFPIDEQHDVQEEKDHRLEGLIHISELSWKRVDHPRDVVAMGDRVRAQIINIEGSKIFLSLKRLSEDPWLEAGKRYEIGQQVTGRVVKMQPFGVFVELDPEIHGLAHISELGDPPPSTPEEVLRIGDEKAFTVISLDPKEHRLGLSLKPASSIPSHTTEAADATTSDAPADGAANDTDASSIAS